MIMVLALQMIMLALRLAQNQKLVALWMKLDLNRVVTHMSEFITILSQMVCHTFAVLGLSTVTILVARIFMRKTSFMEQDLGDFTITVVSRTNQRTIMFTELDLLQMAKIH